MNPSDAILGQESGVNPNIGTSIDGAVGIGQIMPATFAQYAKPGERIDSPVDNLAVHGRIVDDLSQRFNGDPARIAVGYFSGPGNVAHPESPTPWKVDHADGNGKTVSGYVSDVMGRLQGGASQNTLIGSSGDTIDIQMPDGTLIKDAPSNITKAELTAKLQSNGVVPRETQSPPGFLDRVSQDLSNRGQEGLDALTAYAGGEQGKLQTAAQVIGKSGFGSVWDTAGEAAKSLWQSDPNEPIQAALTKGVQSAANLAKPLTDAYQGFAQENPNAARTIEGVGNIAAAFPIAKPAAAAIGAAGDILGSVGQAIEASGQKSALKTKSAFVADLITPKQTPTVKNDMFSRSTEQGKILRQAVVEPTDIEKGIIKDVSILPVSSSKSLLANYNIIDKANLKEATDLVSKLKNHPAIYQIGELNNALETSMDTLKSNPFITGDAEASANKVIDGFKSIVSKNVGTGKITPAKLLQSRKDFDAWVKDQKGANVFDPTRDTPVTIAVQNIRQTVNDLIEKKVPGVKSSLKKQSNYYRAMDSIETKGGMEGRNIISRTVQKAAKLAPGKTIAQKAAIAALGAGTAYAAPVLTGLGLGGYGLYRGAISPLTRTIPGKAINSIGDVLSKMGRP